MDFRFTEEENTIRQTIRDFCKQYPSSYWREVDREKRYPEEFVNELTKAGWLAALIPEEYGGGGLTMLQASIILEEINRAGGNSAACHAQMYIMGTVMRHGNERQKREYLPKIATGELRLQAFGVTEPNAGVDTLRLQTMAVKDGDHYVVNGSKVWTSRVQHSDLMLLLARTSPPPEGGDRTRGLSVFLVDLRTAGDALEVRPIETMINHETNQLFFNNMIVPAENLIGEEGMGFRYILDGMNAERILVASEAIGDGYYFIDRAVEYGNERVVFGRPISQNQGVQFPIAQAYAHVYAADLMRYKAASLFDQKEKCGAEANLAKLLAAESAWEAANACMTTYGGYGFATEFDIERKFRETRLFLNAPVPQNLVLAFVGQHVLGMKRSF
jgi:acyl-CoA dehydrogenase